MNKRVFVVDNYDSFTYNLVHYIEGLGGGVCVRRNDQLTIDMLAGFDKILLSPGPGIPKEAGLTKEIISHYASKKSILGVCLGHQAIGEVFGASLENLTQVYHGVATDITLVGSDALFKDLPNTFKAGRYHSWIVKKPLPKTLTITAIDDTKNIMALKHSTYDIRGIQFHPESILTPLGKKIIHNWLNM